MESKPKTRTAAAAPAAAEKLSEPEQRALETSEEAEHATGEKKEALIKKAGKLGEQGETQ